MKKINFSLMILAFSIFIPLAFAQETMTLTTYYPSPAGSYSQVKLVAWPLGTRPTCSGSNEWGTLFYEEGPDAATPGILYICENDGTGNAKWTPAGGGGTGFWSRNNASGFLFPGTITDFIGIGTNNPQEALEVNGNIRIPATSATGGAILQGTNLFMHSAGNWNTFLGLNAGNLTLAGIANTAVGSRALMNHTSGDNNTAIGASALENNTTGFSNTAIGSMSLRSNIDGDQNVAIGENALNSNTAGNANTAIGILTLQNNTTGGINTAVGAGALGSNTTGVNNVAVGSATIEDNTTGQFNTAVGSGALRQTTGGNNVGIGFTAGEQNVSGADNVFVGHNAQPTANNLINAIAIGSQAQVGASNSMALGGTGANAVNVGIGTTTPAEALDVNGNIIASGTICDSTGCIGGGGAVMYLRSDGVNPAACPAAGWAEVDIKNEAAAGEDGDVYLNRVRTCVTDRKCAVMYLRSDGVNPAACPIANGWIEADFKNEVAGAFIPPPGPGSTPLINRVRTCYRCN
ncbi:MAG: hypothetical protein ABIJ41_06785 [Candidatus Omnitrophota bacterium]